MEVLRKLNHWSWYIINFMSKTLCFILHWYVIYLLLYNSLYLFIDYMTIRIHWYRWCISQARYPDNASNHPRSWILMVIILWFIISTSSILSTLIYYIIIISIIVYISRKKNIKSPKKWINVSSTKYSFPVACAACKSAARSLTAGAGLCENCAVIAVLHSPRAKRSSPVGFWWQL